MIFIALAILEVFVAVGLLYLLIFIIRYASKPAQREVLRQKSLPIVRGIIEIFIVITLVPVLWLSYDYVANQSIMRATAREIESDVATLGFHSDNLITLDRDRTSGLDQGFGAPDSDRVSVFFSTTKTPNEVSTTLQSLGYQPFTELSGWTQGFESFLGSMNFTLNHTAGSDMNQYKFFTADGREPMLDADNNKHPNSTQQGWCRINSQSEEEWVIYGYSTAPVTIKFGGKNVTQPGIVEASVNRVKVSPANRGEACPQDLRWN